MKRIFIAAISLAIFSQVKAQVFEQDFNQSVNIKDYVNKKAPKNNQLNFAEADGEGKVNISKGKLRLSKIGPGGRPYIIRNTPLEIPSQFLSFSFKIDVTAEGDATAFLALGSNFNNEAIPDSVNKNTVRLLFKLLPKGFIIRNTNQGQDGPNRYTGEQEIHWFVNRSGKTQTYTAPDGSEQTVAADRWDLWVGKTKEFDEAGFTNVKQPIANFKFSFLSSLGDILLDDIVIKDLGSK
ncbi:MAG: hypothetical protein EOO90_12860 [Pedobacter sp.]|nr:MAG: hypothetical protein EOO90_12860 [Pedobacter sp.]